MFPLISKRETGVNLRRIMDMRGVNMPTIDNLYALSELLQVPIDAIVRGNRAPIAPDIGVKQPDFRESRFTAYYEKFNEKRAA